MNKKVAVLFFAFVIFLGGFINTQAQANLNYERIEDFTTTVELNKDSSINVREDITYNSGTLVKHGIYRDIKLVSAQGKKLKISDIKMNSPYTIEYPSKDIIRLKIGDANVTFTGQRFYSLVYKISGAVSYFKDFDEIYWNATGNNWPFPIMKANAAIIFPVGVNSINNACYYGPAGSTLKCDISDMYLDASSTPEVKIARVPSVTTLHAGDGLTFASSFPKGLILQPKMTLWDYILDNIEYFFILLPLLAFIFMYKKWSKYGRDPKSGRTIVAQYEAPDNLTPIEVAGILKEKISANTISAEIIYLAVNGYLKIEKIENKILFITTDDYLFKQTLGKEPDNVADAKLFNAVFAYFVGQTDRVAGEVKMSSLKNVFYTKITKISDNVFEKLVTNEYFKDSPTKIRNKYISYSGITFLITFVPLMVLASKLNLEITPISFISTILTPIIVLIFAFFMPARTEKGLLTKEYILGFKEYLQIAEKDRINFHNAPEKKPEIFEKFLPYAMVLGVEKAWAKEFEDMYMEPPKWYADSHMTTFNSMSFVSNLNHFSSYSSGVMTSTPGGSGRSGSGGGGFSGGGGGGGGGGSW